MPKNSDKQKNIFDVIKEVNKKEADQAYSQKVDEINREREEYEKNIYQDKIELARLKQGLPDDSENNQKLSSADAPDAVIMTPTQKISNFIYHNKWWLGLACVFILIGVLIITNLLSNKKADATVLLLTGSSAIMTDYNNLESFITENLSDYDNNGENVVDIYYLPIGTDSDLYGLYEQKLTEELNDANSLLIIADSILDDYCDTDSILYNLEDDFPDNPHISGGKFYLKDTAFEDLIDNEYELNGNVYIGIRKVVSGQEYTDEMQQNFDEIYPDFVKIIESLS